MNDYGRVLPTFQLRRKAAINLIKEEFLGDKHIGGDPQSKLILPILRNLFPGNSELSEKTWQTWIQGSSNIKDGKLKTLDSAFASKSGLDDYISSLIRGDDKHWAVEGMLGAIVRHFAAIDAAAFFGEKMHDSWRSEKIKRSNAVIEVLHALWNPDSGEIYKSFRSDDKINFDLASDEEKLDMVNQYNSFPKFVFQSCMNQHPKPCSEVTEYFRPTDPISVVEFLWQMAKDKDFLHFERLDMWCMDLASAGAAFYGLGYANRYEVFGTRLAPESSQISAMDELFWTENTDLETVFWHWGISVTEQNTSDILQVRSRLWDARSKYHSLLARLGITPGHISQVLERQWNEWPIVYGPHTS